MDSLPTTRTSGMSAAREPQLRVLELRSAVGAGGGPEKTILLGARPDTDPSIRTAVCYIRDRRDTGHDLQQRASGLGVDYHEIVEAHSFDYRIVPSLLSLIRREGFHILHAHDYKTDLLGLLLSRRTRTIPLATAHGWTGQSRRERYVYYPADKRILARYPRVVAVSNEIRNELIRTGSKPSAVDVVLNGIDPDHFHRVPERRAPARASLGIDPGDFVLGGVGRLERQKRFDLLIEAAARLQRRWPNLRLLIAGDGTLRSELESCAGTSGLGERCRLLGHMSDVVTFHHALDLFVQSSDYEGTPNAVLEAMAMETPVIATDAGGTAELVSDGVHGRVIQRGSAVVLAGAIEELLASGETRQRFARQARSRVEQELSFAARMRKIHAIYRELASMRPQAVRFSNVGTL